MLNIKLSGFTLAKGKQLTGDDAYEMFSHEDMAVAIVCDGVGSAERGAEAAQRTASFLATSLKTRPQSWSIEKSLKHFIANINAILYNESQLEEQRSELVTTLAIAVIIGDRLYGANVGDSRIYLSRQNILSQLSRDHVVEEKGMEGVLSQAIGIVDSVTPYYFENIIQEKDRLLICCDGLYTVMDDELLSKHIKNGAHYLVKESSCMMSDNLLDDTTAIVMDVASIDKRHILKQEKLPIPESLKQGDIIDGYTLLEPLIQNERTWSCEKKEVKFVIKFAPFEALENETLLDLFVKEAWNANRLKAGFFPKAAIPKKRSQRYYIMRLIEGVSLKEYLKKRNLSIDEGVHLAKFLLKMEQYLLKYDLVHGDIKPENILVYERQGKKVFKMVDYGSITELFSTTSRAGTPSYLAPGRFHGASINEQSEIYAMGVTVYESLCRKYPYGEIEPFQTPTFKNPKFPSKYNKNIPSFLESILLRSISVETKVRYKHYSEMIFELDNTDKVTPFFNKNTPILEREPLKFCKIGFFILLILNIYQLANH